MRRLIAVLVCLAAVVAGVSGVAVAPPAGAQLPRDEPERGLVYAGLRRAGNDSACRGAYEVVSRRPGSQTRCTHGPDPVPADLDPRPGQDPTVRLGEPAPTAGLGDAFPPGTVGCFGNGTDGYRVQLMYAREAGTPDRYFEYEARFREWAARVDDVFNASAAKTGGIRHVRYVTDSQCRPLIQRVIVSAAAVDSFSVHLDELENQGYARTDRKYLIWVDTPKPLYCGIALTYDDFVSNPTPGFNANNGHPDYKLSAGRVDTRCWGQHHPVEAHEVLHMLGGVIGYSNPALAAPHATNNSHCTDESDRLCYADGVPSGVFKPGGIPTSLTFTCPATQEALLDCGNDDYFHTNPPFGNWLATNWNTANSAWLARAPAGTTTSTATGSTWFSNGTKSAFGPSGTTIRVHATGAIAGVPYQLVTGRAGVNPSQPCAVDLVPVNATVVYAGPSGLLGRVTGTVSRLPGTYQVCFAQVDPVSGSRSVTGAATFTVG